MSNDTSTTSRSSGTRRALGASALAGLAAAFIAVTILSSFALRGIRLDLTENRLYSIAPGTERILAGIGELTERTEAYLVRLAELGVRPAPAPEGGMADGT